MMNGDNMKFTFCPDCGAKLIGCAIGDDGDVPYCERCNRPWFDIFYNCVIVLVKRGDKYALIRQHSGDGTISEDRYVCVSGYIKTGETAEQAAVREVTEELGLKPLSVHLAATYAYNKKPMLMTGFLAELPEGEFSLSDELITAQWFDETDAAKKLADSSVAKLLFKDIKGEKL